jgi:NADH:ubiquinone oxidoreductase subunit 6 (subunit J)
MIGDQGLFPQPTEQFVAGGIYPLGEALFSKYLLPFEVASLLLLVALIGTVYLAKRKV